MTKEPPDSLPRSPDNICGSRDSTPPRQEGTDTPPACPGGAVVTRSTALQGHRDVTVGTQQLRLLPC